MSAVVPDTREVAWRGTGVGRLMPPKTSRSGRTRPPTKPPPLPLCFLRFFVVLPPGMPKPDAQKGNGEKEEWRRGRDSNPRYRFR